MITPVGTPLPQPASATTVIGLSGGVDSSVAAWLLQQQGLSVQAIYMQNWQEPDGRGCEQARLDAQDAYSVAASLCIPIHTANLSECYQEQVFAPCLEAFRQGLTPNPDVLCNQYIKFRAFLDHAMALGADCIATGHYARVRRHAGTLQLLRALDTHKDQSYFLYRLDQEQLARVRFPLGELQKSAVRRMATQVGLVTCDKPDSTGICFIGEQNFRAFLGRYLPLQNGDIVTTDGRKLGTHDGIWFHTIGQRRGLGIGGSRDGSGAPWYVAAKDPAQNRLVVVQGAQHPDLYASEAEGTDCHWIAGVAPTPPCRCEVRLRHGQPLQGCTLTDISTRHCRVRFDTPQWAVAPGQSMVFYTGEHCLGGSIIIG